MTFEFKLPDLGEGIQAADVIRVLVSPGDTVAKDQPVFELETGKATIELPSPAEGTISQILVSAGQKIKVGQVLLVIDSSENPAAQSADMRLAPAQPTVPSTPPPAVSSEHLPLDPERVSLAPLGTPFGAGTRHSPPPVRAAPSVRTFAREIGIEIADVPGTGEGGRVTVDDVKRYAKGLNTRRAAGGAPAAPPPLPDFSKWGPVEREPVSAIRRKTAEHMILSWTTIPHVTQFDEADITSLDERRKKLAPRSEKTGGKLTITPILVKIVASALKVFPKFSAALDPAAGEIIYRKYGHIGVAVETERGLLVPVVRDADRKNIIEIASELARLSEASRAGKLKPDEMAGGCFTVTNLGGIGGTHFTPIINYPEVAILGVGRARMAPCFGKGICQPRLVLPLSLSYDHRLIDGADGARFLRWIVDAIEEPLLIPLEG